MTIHFGLDLRRRLSEKAFDVNHMTKIKTKLIQEIGTLWEC